MYNKLKIKYSLLFIAACILLLLPVYYWYNSLDANNYTDRQTRIFAGLLVFFISFFLILWVVKSIKNVGSESIGCILEFGRPLYQVGPGLYFIPLGFCEMRKETRLSIDEIFPDNDPLNNPIRINHGSTLHPTGDPLDSRMTTSLSLACRYKITDFVTFIREIGNRRELKKHIRNILINTITGECSKYSLAINLKRRNELNYLLTSTVQKLTTNLGIEVSNVQLLELDVTNEIERAHKTISAINMASNKYNSPAKNAFDDPSNVEFEKMFHYAKTDGINEIAMRLGVDSKVAMYQIETLANIWRKSNADMSLYGTDVQHLFSILLNHYRTSHENAGNSQKIPA